MKKTLFFLFFVITTNVLAYKAVTEEGINVELYAQNLQQFLIDYTEEYKAVKQAHSSHTFRIINKNFGIPDEIKKGSQGSGTYGAIGGNEFSINYTVLGAQSSLYPVFPKKIKVYETTKGIIGTHLYGARLYELYEIAEFLENSKNYIAQVFNKNIIDPELADLKRVLTDFRFKFGDTKNTGLISILDKIELQGKNAIDFTKNYSEAALSAAQVKAIDNLNGALKDLSQQFLSIAATDNLFFEYVAALLNKKNL